MERKLSSPYSSLSQALRKACEFEVANELEDELMYLSDRFFLLQRTLKQAIESMGPNPSCESHDKPEDLANHIYEHGSLRSVFDFNIKNSVDFKRVIYEFLKADYAESLKDLSFVKFVEREMRLIPSTATKILRRMCQKFHPKVKQAADDDKEASREVHYTGNQTTLFRCMKLFHCNEAYESTGIVGDIGQVNRKKSPWECCQN